jgi:hypothetical protein
MIDALGALRAGRRPGVTEPKPESEVPERSKPGRPAPPAL